MNKQIEIIRGLLDNLEQCPNDNSQFCGACQESIEVIQKVVQTIEVKFKGRT